MAPGSKPMSRSSMASLALEALEMSEMSEPRRWWRWPVISPFLKAKGAACVVERREMAATVMAAEESFMLIDWVGMLVGSTGIYGDRMSSAEDCMEILLCYS